MARLVQSWPPHEEWTPTIPVFTLSAYTLQDFQGPVYLNLLEHQACFISQIADALDKEINIVIADTLCKPVNELVINIEFSQKHDQKGGSQFITRLGNHLCGIEMQILVESLIATLDYMFSTREDGEYHIEVFCPTSHCDLLPYIITPFDDAGLKVDSDIQFFDFLDLDICNTSYLISDD